MLLSHLYGGLKASVVAYRCSLLLLLLLRLQLLLVISLLVFLLLLISADYFCGPYSCCWCQSHCSFQMLTGVLCGIILRKGSGWWDIWFSVWMKMMKINLRLVNRWSLATETQAHVVSSHSAVTINTQTILFICLFKLYGRGQKTREAIIDFKVFKFGYKLEILSYDSRETIRLTKKQNPIFTSM